MTGGSSQAGPQPAAQPPIASRTPRQRGKLGHPQNRFSKCGPFRRPMRTTITLPHLGHNGASAGEPSRHPPGPRRVPHPRRPTAPQPTRDGRRKWKPPVSSSAVVRNPSMAASSSRPPASLANRAWRHGAGKGRAALKSDRTVQWCAPPLFPRDWSSSCLGQSQVDTLIQANPLTFGLLNQLTVK